MKVDDGESTYFYILGIISSSLCIPDLTFTSTLDGIGRKELCMWNRDSDGDEISLRIDPFSEPPKHA